MPSIVIDPANLTLETREMLKTFLLSEIKQGKSSWAEGQAYSWVENDTQSEPIFIQFTSSLLLRSRKLAVSSDEPKEECQLKDGYRLEVYRRNMKKIGQGDQGVILGGLGTLALNGDGVTFHTKKERAIKFFKTSTIAKQEAAISVFVPQLHAKPTVQTVLDGSAMVMRRLPGQTLSSLLKAQLPMTTRLLLSVAILRAYETQVANIFLLHRDIKPSNIMVNMVDEQFDVNFIDYATACIIDRDFCKLNSRFLSNGAVIALPFGLRSPTDLQTNSGLEVSEKVALESPVRADAVSPVGVLLNSPLPPAWEFMLPVESSSMASLTSQTVGVVGTFGYIPPEGYVKSATLTKTYDHFALGKVLAHLWGIQITHYTEIGAADAQKESSRECFTGKIPVAVLECSGDRAEIEMLLTAMCHADADKRPALHVLISAFESMLDYYQEDKLSCSFS